jgi:putative peptidoglycan lipid II flippase
VRNGIDRVQALVIGALAGGMLQVVAQWPALARLGFLRRPIVDFADPGVREMGRRIAPMTLGVGVYYIDLVLSSRFLSEMGTGAQSYFNWAMRLCDFPQGIFVMALSTAALPSLSALAAKNDLEEMSKTYALGMRLAMFVAIPASVALVFLGEPLVAALFQRGEFDATAVQQTARALAWQGGAIWTVSAVRQIVPVFYALGDTRTPVVVSAIDLTAFIVLALVLRGPMGHAGISAAIAGSSTVQMALLAVALRRKIRDVRAGEVGASLARTLAASLAGAGAGVAVARAVVGLGTTGKIARMLPGLGAGVAFVLAFVVVARLLGSRELATLGGGLARRLRRKR